ncbi:hypothetical protein Rhow_003126 [Rhodococcus wratislaviensis]|uniref:Uncharacterized protein n=1 Tax=Rhodococcus wratislaviensis TaxID=44752 RepID=A0A402C7M5_RHOWR|nr:hypothetical protein Rhow_003126 [Rhodococcus wratislaviensis]
MGCRATAFIHANSAKYWEFIPEFIVVEEFVFQTTRQNFRPFCLECEK